MVGHGGTAITAAAWCRPVGGAASGVRG